MALDQEGGVVRFGFCRRSEDRLLGGVSDGDDHVRRFLEQMPKLQSLRRETIGIAPSLGQDVREKLKASGWLAEDLSDLLIGL